MFIVWAYLSFIIKIVEYLDLYKYVKLNYNFKTQYTSYLIINDKVNYKKYSKHLYISKSICIFAFMLNIDNK